ncbi:hypothetical protein [Bacteriovorax sp. DB6_IX]|uniref:hypothetical protein n=1 Tax=Bacteriovorax sp. DB6_IX TaxID=1353530 RepID=UPI00038A07FB|nr:hypothetical protein [Bacteriovorax sp. DB6_IX]EQC45091.1 putative lipoprotein [Bacteriovorax sp. DB6_IX]
MKLKLRKSKFVLISTFFIFFTIGCSTTQTYIGPTQPYTVRNSSLDAPVAPDRAILYISQYGKGSGCTLFVNRQEIGKVNYYNTIMLDVPAGKHKILCYFGKKATQAWFDKHYDTYKNITMTATGGKKHSVFYRWKHDKSYGYNRPYLVVYNDPKVVNPYVKKRFLLKMPVASLNTNHQDLKESVAWTNAQNANTVDGYQSFLANYPNTKHKEEADSAISTISKREKDDFDKAMSSRKFDPAFVYLKDHLNQQYAQKALENAIAYNKKIKSSKARIGNYQRLASLDEKFIASFPSSIRYEMSLMQVGPSEFNVAKIIELKKEGLSPSIIAAKIMATNQRYKNFEIDEIKFLKKKGLSDSIIESMLKTTATYDNQVKQVQQNKEMMASIQKLIQESQKQNSRRSSFKRQPARYSNQGSNQVGSCLQQKLAMEACRKVGGFMRSACEITAKSTYPCQTR